MNLSPGVRNLLAAFIVALFGVGVVGTFVVSNDSGGDDQALSTTTTNPGSSGSPTSTESPTSIAPPTSVFTDTTVTPTTVSGGSTTTTAPDSGLGTGGTGSAADGADGTAQTGGEWMLIPGLLASAAAFGSRRLRSAASAR